MLFLFLLKKYTKKYSIFSKQYLEYKRITMNYFIILLSTFLMYLMNINDIFQGFVLAYDVTNWESFQRLDKLKKDIDKYRDKKEVSFSLILSRV